MKTSVLHYKYMSDMFNKPNGWEIVWKPTSLLFQAFTQINESLAF